MFVCQMKSYDVVMLITGSLTASAAYQKMAKRGTELGTESESEGVEDALAPSFASKMPSR